MMMVSLGGLEENRRDGFVGEAPQCGCTLAASAQNLRGSMARLLSHRHVFAQPP
jgi:hypothetical protein